MITLSPEQIEALKTEWTDQFVRINPVRPELMRFENRVGRVVTVNFNGKALIDFADGAWYDIAASADVLTKVSAEEAQKAKFDPKANSAQPIPSRAG